MERWPYEKRNHDVAAFTEKRNEQGVEEKNLDRNKYIKPQSGLI